jgi:hypothetical protein
MPRRRRKVRAVDVEMVAISSDSSDTSTLTDSESICSMCCVNFIDTASVCRKHHMFCRRCFLMEKFLRGRCPNCNEDISYFDDGIELNSIQMLRSRCNVIIYKSFTWIAMTFILILYCATLYPLGAFIRYELDLVSFGRMWKCDVPSCVTWGLMTIPAIALPLFLCIRCFLYIRVHGICRRFDFDYADDDIRLAIVRNMPMGRDNV